MITNLRMELFQALADMQIICKSAVRESAGGRGAGDPGRTISCAARAGRLLFTDARPVIGAEREGAECTVSLLQALQCQ